LKALAFPLFDRRETLVAAMIDARNARVFSAAYFNGTEVVPEAARTIDEFVGLCDSWRERNAPGSAIITCGNACEIYTAGTGGAKSAGRPDVRAMTAFTEIDPRAVAAIGEEVFLESDETERNRIFIPEALLPVYLARTAAERNLDNKL
jgi:tRNA A37 threonylcarbamoyladenosine modification protein TsaB